MRRRREGRTEPMGRKKRNRDEGIQRRKEGTNEEEKGR